ncbi:MAG: putative metallopeptidase [Candidatus Micrarchaeota archaeon]|nr:putative metallopeptidase [Candidatus Micrarchaeota archaeon]
MPAEDVQKKLEDILAVFSRSENNELAHINQFRIICMRTEGSKANAYARIWNLPKIWQVALSVGAFYIIEVVSPHYDKLPEEEKTKVLIHELLHIPKNFSGALRPHNGRIKIDRRNVERLYKIYCKQKSKEGEVR